MLMSESSNTKSELLKQSEVQAQQCAESPVQQNLNIQLEQKQSQEFQVSDKIRVLWHIEDQGISPIQYHWWPATLESFNQLDRSWVVRYQQFLNFSSTRNVVQFLSSEMLMDLSEGMDEALLYLKEKDFNKENQDRLLKNLVSTSEHRSQQYDVVSASNQENVIISNNSGNNINSNNDKDSNTQHVQSTQKVQSATKNDIVSNKDCFDELKDRSQEHYNNKSNYEQLNEYLFDGQEEEPKAISEIGKNLDQLYSTTFGIPTSSIDNLAMQQLENFDHNRKLKIISNMRAFTDRVTDGLRQLKRQKCLQEGEYLVVTKEMMESVLKPERH